MATTDEKLTQLAKTEFRNDSLEEALKSFEEAMRIHSELAVAMADRPMTVEVINPDGTIVPFTESAGEGSRRAK